MTNTKTVAAQVWNGNGWTTLESVTSSVPGFWLRVLGNRYPRAERVVIL